MSITAKKSSILKELLNIEKTHQVKILYACESGSRAWGFPSPDSDYDVRFIYLHPIEWYLSIHERPDTLELMINKELDINGWDFKKALQLCAKNNAALFEWLQSPAVYINNAHFIKNFRKISSNCFSPIAGMYHYLHISETFYKEYVDREEVRLKKYMYCLRSALACHWISQHQSLPPMEIGKLMSVINGNIKLINKINSLIELKSGKTEAYIHYKEPLLNNYINKVLTHCKGTVHDLQRVKPDVNALDKFFLKILQH